jgi:hypothetical protein
MAVARRAIPKRKPPALPKQAEGGDITIQRELNPNKNAAPPDSATMARIDKEQRLKAKVAQLKRRQDTI